MSLNRHHSAGYMTNWAARAFTPAIDLRLKPLGISSAHLPVFFALSDGKTLPQKALAAAAAVEQPTMAATLNRMERDGLIERVPDPLDGRSSLVSLTQAAQSKVAAVHKVTREVNEIALSGLTKNERETLLVLLEKVVVALTQDAELRKTQPPAAVLTPSAH